MNIIVRSPDSDVFILLLSYTPLILFDTGTIDVSSMCMKFPASLEQTLHWHYQHFKHLQDATQRALLFVRVRKHLSRYCNQTQSPKNVCNTLELICTG